jgi:hypothetical protein
MYFVIMNRLQKLKDPRLRVGLVCGVFDNHNILPYSFWRGAFSEAIRKEHRTSAGFDVEFSIGTANLYWERRSFIGNGDPLLGTANLYLER